MSKNILVVDDKRSFRKLVETTLSARGFEVRSASNGVEALAEVARSSPDLMLLDLRMPEMDGLAVLKALRARPSTAQLPVIVLSAFTDRSKILQAAQLGISGYVLKTALSIPKMLARINAALSGQTPSEAPGERSQEAPKTPVPSTSAGQGRPATEELKPLMMRQQVLDRISAVAELTAFSPSVSHLLTITADQNCSLTQVGDAVNRDPVIALKILKLANSSLYAHGERSETVRQAVRRIGIQGTRQAVMNIGVVETFGAASFAHHFSTSLFWEHSVACGIIAAELARASGEADVDSAFTCGLLHDLGRMVLLQALKEDYLKVLEAARRLGEPLELVEARMLTATHADIMDTVLAAWSFPKQLIDPIRYHHVEPDKVRRVAPTCADSVLRLGLANRLAHALILGHSGNETIYPIQDHCGELGITAETLHRIEESARRKTDDAKLALMSTSDPKGWSRRLDLLRAELACTLRPLIVSASPDFDAYRMFLHQLLDTSASASPNVVVAHLQRASFAAALSEQVRTLEQKAGVSNLPVLLLTSQPNLILEDNVMHGRATITLPSPTPVSRLLPALRQLASPLKAVAA